MREDKDISSQAVYNCGLRVPSHGRRRPPAVIAFNNNVYIDRPRLPYRVVSCRVVPCRARVSRSRTGHRLLEPGNTLSLPPG